LRSLDPEISISRIAVAAALWTLVSLGTSAEQPSRVAFAEGYRNWFHVKSATGDEGKNIHHIYANARALEGYKAGAFPDGSVLVFDVLEFKTNDDKTATEGTRRRIDVMLKDATRFKSTGGWGYEEYQADSRAGSLSDGQAQGCASCHASRKDHDSVFSTIRP
jgi:Cytochrome P460